jgi:hypothetical protein
VLTITGTLKPDPGPEPVKNTSVAKGDAEDIDTKCPDGKDLCDQPGTNDNGIKSLRITKRIDTTNPLPDQEVTYTVTVENTGSVTYEGGHAAALDRRRPGPRDGGGHVQGADRQPAAGRQGLPWRRRTRARRGG